MIASDLGPAPTAAVPAELSLQEKSRQFREIMQAALREVGRGDLALGVLTPLNVEHGAMYSSVVLRSPRRLDAILVRKAAAIAAVGVYGPHDKTTCNVCRSRSLWLPGEPQPPEWEHCTLVTTWERIENVMAPCWYARTHLLR